VAALVVPFRGLNTDVNPTRLESGTADIALNVLVENELPRKRGGFSQWEDDADGSATGIKHIDVARFADGDVYVVIKVGAKLYQRKIGETSFSEITTEQTHNANDRGWSGMWGDDWFYFDRAGGSRWNPDVNSGTAYKAGLPKPAAGPRGEIAASGEKDGRYHFWMGYRNSETREEGVVAGTFAPALECDLYTNKGGIATTNWVSTIRGQDTAYKWDEGVFFCSMGSTEDIREVECFSYRAYRDVVKKQSDNTEVGMNKADHVLDQRDAFTNAGGEPPGAGIGVFTPTRGVYGRVYISSTLHEDKIQFSIPDFPTMVPKEISYTVGGDSKSFSPQPWVGEVIGGVPGGAVAMAYGGGMTVAAGTNSTYRLVTGGDEKLRPVRMHNAKGSAGDGAIVGTPHGVYLLGYNTFQRVHEGYIEDLAHRRFSSTINNIPADYYSSTSMAAYGFEDQVWAAVVKGGDTVAKRILIWDRHSGGEVDGQSIGALTIFEPVNLGTDEGITSMVELAEESASPTMLVATNEGRILQYPSGSQDESTNYTAKWRGYFATEGAALSQRLEELHIHAADNVKGKVTLGFEPLRTGTYGDATEKTVLLGKSNGFIKLSGSTLGKVDGRMFRLTFSSDGDDSTAWKIAGVSLIIERTG